MADTFTTLLRLIKQETGGNENVWGDFLNIQMIDLIDDAVAGFQDVDVTLSNQILLPLNGDDDPTRAAILVASGLPPDATRTIQVPSTSKLYVLSNETSEIVTFKTASGSGLAVAPGDTVSSRVDPTLDDVVAVTVASATEDLKGIAEIATQAEVDAGTDDERIVTPLKLTNFPAVNQATETVKGVAELADSTEANEDVATDDLRIITPLKLDGRTATEDRRGVIALANQAEVDAGVVDNKAVTPATLGGAPIGAYSGCTVYRTTHFVAGHTAGNAAGQVPLGIGIPTDLGEQPIPFDAEIFDTGLADFGTEFHSTSTNPTRITIPAGVNFVRLSGSAIWDQSCAFVVAAETCDPNTNGSGLRHMRIRKNGNAFLSFLPGATGVRGTGEQYQPWTMSAGNSQETGQEVQSVVVGVDEDDYFELMVFTQGSDFPDHRVRSGAVFEMQVVG